MLVPSLVSVGLQWMEEKLKFQFHGKEDCGSCVQLELLCPGWHKRERDEEREFSCQTFYTMEGCFCPSCPQLFGILHFLLQPKNHGFLKFLCPVFFASHKVFSSKSMGGQSTLYVTVVQCPKIKI